MSVFMFPKTAKVFAYCSLMFIEGIPHYKIYNDMMPEEILFNCSPFQPQPVTGVYFYRQVTTTRAYPGGRLAVKKAVSTTDKAGFIV